MLYNLLMSFKYETHLHTAEASACGTSQGAEYISVYKKLGYDGIFVTDHFFGGNTAVSHELDWHARIDLYCKGYENALAEAKRQNEADGKQIALSEPEWTGLLHTSVSFFPAQKPSVLRLESFRVFIPTLLP